MTYLNEIDLNRAYERMRQFFAGYDANDPGNRLKIVHTYHVAENARILSEKLRLSKEDSDLAVLIGLLHDVGRFEELAIMKQFNNTRFDHASYGVKMLKEGMLRDFITTDIYDDIICEAIAYHSLYELPEIKDERTLLHAKLLRDCDKLDNFRVKIEEEVENLFGGRVNSREAMEHSVISQPVYEALLQNRCVDVKDRVTPLDYYVTIIGFYFGIAFEQTRQIIKEERLIEKMVRRFDYKDETTALRMETIRKLCD